MFYSVPCFQFLFIQHISNTPHSLSPSSVSMLFPAQLLLHSLKKIHNQQFITIQCVHSGICFKRSFFHTLSLSPSIYSVLLHTFHWFFNYRRSSCTMIYHDPVSVLWHVLCASFPIWNQTDHLQCEHIVFQSWNPLQVVLHLLHNKHTI